MKFTSTAGYSIINQYDLDFSENLRANLCEGIYCIPDCQARKRRSESSMMNDDENHIDIAIGPISIRT